MKDRIMNKIIGCLAFLAGTVMATAATAQAYPDHNLKLVVPQTAGGPSDVLGRLFALKLGESLGKPVIVENRPGAGGNIGTEMVVRAKPDGYTLLVNISGILAINDALYKHLPYDAARDLEGVSRIVTSQLALVAHPSFQPNSIKELVAYAKAQPPLSISYGSAGTGSPQHVGGELLNTKAGIKLNHIPYKGAIPALNDLLGGQVPLAIVGLPAVLPHAKAGKLKILGVFGGTRSALASDVPTFVESGFPDIEMELAYGIFTARGAPPSVIARLNHDIAAILKMPDVREKLVGAGFEVGGSTPAELDQYLKAEIQKWRPIVRDSGATAN
jgi:tripartite-type tricarboxylate transporter receptor subunit TctC